MDAKARELKDYMSQLSEKAYCARWMKDLEYALWYAVTHGTRSYGRLRITGKQTAHLRALVEACGGWIIWDDKTAETFIAMDQWLKLYAEKEDISPRD